MYLNLVSLKKKEEMMKRKIKKKKKRWREVLRKLCGLHRIRVVVMYSSSSPSPARKLGVCPLCLI